MPETYKAVCHTKCYWLETLWEKGDVYKGTIEPIKHFSQDGKTENPKPPPNPGDDQRSNVQLRSALKKHPYNFKAPSRWSRKQLWSKLKELEIAVEKDELTNPEDKFFAKCGFQAKTQAGVGAHERRCKICSEEPEVHEAA
jgi:hypothetical protein